MSKRNLEPKKRDPEKEAKRLEANDITDIKIKQKNKKRVGFLIPGQLKNLLYEESNRTGRSVTDIVVEQLFRRYE